MVLCLLATDDEEEDVALQIHFTLIQAFCCENDINILRVSNMRRLAEILGGVKPGGEPMDLHCVLVTVSLFTIELLHIAHFPSDCKQGCFAITVVVSVSVMRVLSHFQGTASSLGCAIGTILLCLHIHKSADGNCFVSSSAEPAVFTVEGSRAEQSEQILQ